MDRIPTHLAKAGEYVEWLRIQLHEKAIPSTNRTRAAVACFALAQEHHHSIVLLAQNRLYGSAFSLLRVAFEAYIRGEWLSSCARDEQVEEFVNGVEPPRLSLMIEQIEQFLAFSQQILSAVKKAHWQSMCAYTHSGGLHIQRWQTLFAVEPNYSSKEIDEVLSFAEIVGFLSGIAIASLANDEPTADRIFQQFNSTRSDG